MDQNDRTRGREAPTWGLSQSNFLRTTMNIDEGDNKDTAIQYGIRSIPAIKSFNGSEVTNTSVGVVSEQSIKEMVTLLV